MSRPIILLAGLIMALSITGCAIQPIVPDAAVSPTAEAIEEATTPSPADESSPFSAEILENLAYDLEVVGDEPVQLTDGVYEDPDNRVYLSWSDTYALGQLDGRPTAAVVLLANTGGSGSFRTLSVVQEREGDPTNIASILLGDRLRMNWIAIADDEITLDLVGQGPDDPMCCGTQRTRLNFVLVDGELVETDAEIIGEQVLTTETQVITFVPTTVPSQSRAGSCFTNAIGLGRVDAWRCTTDDNRIYDPCFEMDDTPTVVCGVDPIDGDEGFVLELTEPLPEPDPGAVTREWLVLLDDGTVCGLLTGTIPGTSDQTAPYGCADDAQSYLMENFLIFDPMWFAQRVQFRSDEQGFVIDASVRIPIVTVWR